MKRVLVTGGAGFIGSHFVRLVLERLPDARVVNLDLLTYAGNLANLADVASSPRYRFVRGDIRDVKTAEARRLSPAAESTTTARPATTPGVSEELEEHFPYIEVGGANRDVEGSPDVMGRAVNPPAKADLPEEVIRFDGPAVPAHKPVMPLGVVFEPLSVTPPRSSLPGDLVVFHDPDVAYLVAQLAAIVVPGTWSAGRVGRARRARCRECR